MSFLTQENAQFLTDFLNQFMIDKYKFSFQKVLPTGTYQKLLSDTMRKVYQQYKHKYELTDLNKATLSELKEFFKVQYQLGGPPPTAAPAPLEPILEEPTISEDSEFFNKLQKLELQRKTFSPTVAGAAPPSSSFTVNPPELSVQQQMASSAVPSNVTTVFMPTPPKIGKELKICSWQRDWIREPSRNHFEWKGPLPKQIDRTNTRLGCIIGPNYLLNETNMISLMIEGVNEDSVSVNLIPSHSVGNYTIYRPILESLSYLRLLALPWKITLEAGDGEELALGMDGVSYNVVKLEDTFTTISLQNASYFCRMGEGLRLYIEKTRKILASTVLAIRENELDISGKIVEPGLLLNYSRQISIVLELMTTEHKN